MSTSEVAGTSEAADSYAEHVNGEPGTMGTQSPAELRHANVEISKTQLTCVGNISEDIANSKTDPAQEIHYRSLSVLAHFSGPAKALSGSLYIIKRDCGNLDELFNIEVSLRWKQHTGNGTGTLSAGSMIQFSVDDLLAVRVVLDAHPLPIICLFGKQGRKLATFAFTNGPDAASTFLTALRHHVYDEEVPDRDGDGQLYAVEAKPRMRRVAPSILYDEDEPFGRAQDTYDSGAGRMGSPEYRGAQRPTDNRQNSILRLRPNPGMVILEQFAKITQMARDVGDDISLAFNERRRQEEQARLERERLARQRALDIYAVFPRSDENEDDLPPCYLLDNCRGVALSRIVWEEMVDERGVILDPAVLRLAIFAGGIDPSIRFDVWPYLLGVYPWRSSTEECAILDKENMSRYKMLKEQWLVHSSPATITDTATLAMSLEQTKVTDHVSVKNEQQNVDITVCSESEEQIEKDIVRTDRNIAMFKQDNSRLLSLMRDILNVYATHNREIGYCQGMSDLLSPLLYVFGDKKESLVFCCFEALMKRYSGNFRVDQSGMRRQLAFAREVLKSTDAELFRYFDVTDPDFYCIFRWIIVCFKRELSFDSTPRLWEIMWTRRYGDDMLHVYVSVGLLRAHRRQLLRLEVGAFDLLLRYINDMSMRINVDFAISQGEKCYLDYHRK